MELQLQRESKKQDTEHLLKTSSTLTDFLNVFPDTLTGKFATNSYLNIPPYLNMSLHYPVKYKCQKTKAI